MSEMLAHPVDAVKHGKHAKLFALGGGAIVAGVVVMRVRAAREDDTSTDDPDATPDTSTDGTLDDDSDASYTGSDNSGYGDYSAAPSASEYGYTNPYGDTITNGTADDDSTETVDGPSTNPAWTQEVVSYLTAQGYDSDTVLAALGAYENKRGLSTTQYQIIEAAIAAEGRPPVYPGAPIHASNAGQNGTSTKKPPAKKPVVKKKPVAKKTTSGTHNTERHGRTPVTHGGGKVGPPLLDKTKHPAGQPVKLIPMPKKTKAPTPKRKVTHR